MDRPVDAAALLGDLLPRPARVLDRWSGRVPELAALRGCPQPSNHHAEGDVWAHTHLALEVFADPDRDRRAVGRSGPRRRRRRTGLPGTDRHPGPGRPAARRRPPRVVDGREVMAALGISSGPRVGAILGWVAGRSGDARTALQLLDGNRDWLRTAPTAMITAAARGGETAGRSRGT